MGTIVGTKSARTTYLAKMVEHLDDTLLLVVGGVPAPTSAEVKVNNARTEAKKARDLALAKDYIDIGDPNDPNKVDLVQVVKELTAELDRTIMAKLAKEEQLTDEQEKFRQAQEANFETRQTLLADKDELMRDVNDIEQKYIDLSALLEQTTDEQVKTVRAQLQQARDDLRALNDTLLKTQAELKMAQDMMKRAQEEVAKIEPGPDREVLAYEPDGQVILIDNQAQVVHLNIGSNEHVYRGLTFTVYDRGTSIPKDGKGKAEIEVFDVAKTYSAARIIPSGLSRPVLQGDIVANLIWDSDKTNVFVIAGDFDLDNDGNIDSNGVDKIKTLIEKWGGKVGGAISVDTDFLILGEQPQVLKKPTLEELEVDPRATERYDVSLQLLNRYTELRSQAQALWVPVFTYEKFLYLIGYEGQVGRAGAF
jgi:hypothetical protein